MGRLSTDELNRLRLLQLRSMKRFMGERQGGHRSKRKGFGMEFSDYRNYELGDSPRFIDWGLFARTDKLYIRRYQEEENISLTIILDCSASLFCPGTERAEKVRTLCEAISLVGLLSGDIIQILPLGGTPSVKFLGKRSYQHISDFLTNLKPTASCSEELCAKAATYLRSPGICLFISDCLFEPVLLDKCLKHLLARNVDLSLIQVQSPLDNGATLSEQDAYIFQDSETGEEYELGLTAEVQETLEAASNEHQKQIQDLCSRRHVWFQPVKEAESIVSIVDGILAGRGFLG